MKKTLFVFMAIFAIAAYADEGMWMPQQMPQIAAELQKAGLKIDPNRLSDLTGDPMGAVISLGGCSASFVSPDGLVVTNHHCAFGAIQYNSAILKKDFLRTGFLAKSREEELKAPGQRVFVTTKIEDVTPSVTGKLSTKLTDAERSKAIETNTKTLTADCEKPGGVRCRVASFFEGSQYLRITQMEIRDVRLVYAPAEGIGNFGGETDNWMWPRHTGDWSFFRAYVGKDGKPADYSADNVPFHPTHILKVAQSGIKPGDFVMVAGYPGRTFRYRTAFEVQQAREFTYPTTIRYATDLSKILSDLGAKDRQIQIRNASRIKGFDNTLKNNIGTLETLKKGDIEKQRTQREADLAAWLTAHPDAAKKYAGVLDKINALDRQNAASRERDAVLGWTGRSSPMLGQAMTLYRYSVEKTKKDLERAPGFQERDAKALEQGTERVQSSIDVPSDRAGLRYMLIEATKLPAGQRIAPIDAMLAKTGKSGVEAVDAFLDQLYANTKVADLAARKAMLSETTQQLEARNDAMINLAAALYPLQKANEEEDRKFGGAMSRVRPLYLEALRDMTGGKLYPDANSTLRITFGNVKGYSPKDAVWYEPQTSVLGVAQKDTGSGEFNSPKNLLAAISEKKFGTYGEPQIGGAVPVDFLSNVDTTGGNSGSPTLNANGELCGLLFDGTYESLGSDFLTNENTRSIHVDSQYMLWVMDAVDGAHNLLQEMGIQPKF